MLTAVLTALLVKEIKAISCGLIPLAKASVNISCTNVFVLPVPGGP